MVNTSNNTKVETKGDSSLEEIIIQCPPVSSSRLRSTIQRSTTLPLQQPLGSSNNTVQRSRTVPNLEPRPKPFTPKKVSGQKLPASNAGRSRVISIPTDCSTTDDESAPPSPATDVSSTLSPTFGRHFPSSPPRETKPSRSSPTRRQKRSDNNQTSPQRYGSGPHEDLRNRQTPATQGVCGTSRQHQSTKKVVWGSPSISRPPGSHPPPSPDGSSHLTYASGGEHPASALAQPTDDTDFYTPLSRNSKMSDDDSEPPKRGSSSGLKRKGKRRASPPPPSPSTNQGSSFQGSRPSSPSLSIGSSPRNPSPVPGSSHKKRRDRYSRPPSPRNGANRRHARDQTPAHDPGQDMCHCAGPCPSCHKPRFPPFPPQFHPSMFYPGYYPHLLPPPPHMQTGYPLSHYGLPPYPYPYAIPQGAGPAPSVSSSQLAPPPPGYPMLTAPATHAHNTSSHHSPAPTPSTSAPVLSPPLVTSSPPVDPLATSHVSPELLEALDQFYQPQQRAVTVIDPSYDPRSPYSKKAAVPAFPNK